MSASQAREEGGHADAMADEPELPQSHASAHARSSSSSDEETVKGDRDEDQIANILEEEDSEHGSGAPSAGPSSAAHRYRELLEPEPEAPSEDGSTDAIPRLAVSPMGSMLSVPDDTPSVQVCGKQGARDRGAGVAVDAVVGTQANKLPRAP